MRAGGQGGGKYLRSGGTWSSEGHITKVGADWPLQSRARAGQLRPGRGRAGQAAALSLCGCLVTNKKEFSNRA
jgi:hypothetical protein